MIIDHISFAVRNLENAISYWSETFGYKQMTGVVVNSLQRVRVVFLSKEDSIIVKLIEPTEGNESLQNFVNKGGGYHHICFRCDDIASAMADLNAKGMLTLVPPQPGEAFNNHDIAFLLGRNGMNIELIDTEEKAEMLSVDPEPGD
jgi:methylmalonyl-CoA/ethylmalonyl-CoA epimerase